MKKKNNYIYMLLELILSMLILGSAAIGFLAFLGHIVFFDEEGTFDPKWIAKPEKKKKKAKTEEEEEEDDPVVPTKEQI